MDYSALRHFADSWGLLFLAAVFLIAVGWAFRPGSSYERHRDIPFRHDDERPS
jgi:cytochrome c oxidase cbb3-type subunit IV